MGGWADGNVHQRMAGLGGRPAEDAFLRVMADEGKELGFKLWRFGADHISTHGAVHATLPAALRFAPDFIQVGGHMWEVQGCGEAMTVVSKAEKLAVQAEWAELMHKEGRELRVAIYVQPQDTLIRITWDHWLWAHRQAGASRDSFGHLLGSDPKVHLRIPVDLLRTGEVVSLSGAMRALKV